VNLKLKEGDIIEIFWLDSHSRSGWAFPEETEEWINSAEKKFTIKTVGYFFHQDKNFVRVCQSHDHQKSYNKDALFAVAKKCITKIKMVRRSK